MCKKELLMKILSFILSRPSSGELRQGLANYGESVRGAS